MCSLSGRLKSKTTSDLLRVCLFFFVRINDFRIFDSAVRRYVSMDVIKIHVALRIFGFSILSRFVRSELLVKSVQHRKKSRATNVKKNYVFYV